MAYTLLQYATWLDSRRDLAWPEPPEVERPKARPHLVRLEDVRAVTWSVYGTLVKLTGGELYFEHPQQFIMQVALDKTIQEFKMWGSMTRKPGQPGDYLQKIYSNLLTDHRNLPSGTEKYPEIASDRLWEAFIKKLLQKDYKFDAGFYGALNEFSRKVAYFFHASLQGTACYPGAAAALKHVVVESGLAQGLVADGQCFTTTQLQRGLAGQDADADLDAWIPANHQALSVDVGARKPSERLFRRALEAFEEEGIEPGQVLHIGSRVAQDVVPARRLGMRTGLFAGDKASLQATAEQMKDPTSRPDVLLTELDQVSEIVP